MLCYQFTCFNCITKLFLQNKASYRCSSVSVTGSVLYQRTQAFLPFLFHCTTCFPNAHKETLLSCFVVHLLQTFKLEQTRTRSQERQYISEHPLASRGLCPNSILKQLHSAIHHADSNLSLSPHTAIDLPSSHTRRHRHIHLCTK